MALFSMHAISPGVNSNESVFDEYTTNPRFQGLQTELRSLLITGAQSAVTTRIHSPEVLSDEYTPVPGNPPLLLHLGDEQDKVSLTKKVRFFKAWTIECAPWLDMFDKERHFGIAVPALARTSPAVLHALLALSARQIERQNMDGLFQDSLELYSEAISCLSLNLDARGPDVLITACILCVLEMMSVNPRDWRRHVEGCAALFQSSGVNGFSGGLLGAAFWCYARMDLCGAIIADGAEGPVLPIDKWVLLDKSLATATTTGDAESIIKDSFQDRGQQTPDMYANYAVYLCAKVCDLTSRWTRYIELGEENGCNEHTFIHAWDLLWRDLELWRLKLPLTMRPVKTVAGSTANNYFPRILFAHWAAISSNQLYHTACILMLENKPAGQRLGDAESAARSPLWHARQIVGISLTNPHRGCLNNAIQPLYVAGKLFSHREEQIVIVDLLKKIEFCSGWGSRWRIKDLETTWGYPKGTFS